MTEMSSNRISDSSSCHVIANEVKQSSYLINSKLLDYHASLVKTKKSQILSNEQLSARNRLDKNE